VTIADLVADQRAPTPSAAAELAVPDGAALRNELALARTRLARALRRYAGLRRDALERSRERLQRRMQRLTQQQRSKLESGAERLESRMRRVVEQRRATVARLAGQVNALSPLHALARGYAVPINDDGRVMRRAADFEPGAAFRLRVVDGTVHSAVREVTSLDEHG
jgi:exodeoxyribonuclease VII large subunit